MRAAGRAARGTAEQAGTTATAQAPAAIGRQIGADTVAVRWQYADRDPRTHARELLRTAAAEAVGAHPAEVRIGRSASGAPQVSGAASGLLVGVSHTRGLVAVVVAGPGNRALGVGVDVEAVRPLDAIALAERWFTTVEAAWVRALPPGLRATGLLDLWTRKEAAGKALGLGLRAGGLRRPVGLPPPGTPPGSPRSLTPLPGDRLLAGGVLPGPHGYVLACAVSGAGTPPALVLVTPPGTQLPSPRPEHRRTPADGSLPSTTPPWRE
ncbi:4'-phosphopantetheinyl transferase superfamily protein [Streptomyces coacervatus]|nr:4'-phosphopantetheinyl transferase superfamily protein [Streptomyces coacervatus]MDF2269763.1 4'-phosphopantetheinyl transferase superfamily protein [Streptomyces coacervatus]